VDDFDPLKRGPETAVSYDESERTVEISALRSGRAEITFWQTELREGAA
jgi:hypothetical protein